MERAIAYIRVSTDRQVKDGSSLQTQQRSVEGHAEQRNYELIRIFVEEGETAKSDNRPILQELLTYAKANRGQINILVFPKIDRFARYTEDYHFLKRYLRNLGIRVESTDERFDDSPAGRFLENMLAAQAQYDNDLRSERCRGGMIEAVKQGRWVTGRAPVGFRNIRYQGRPTIEPNPITAPIVAEAFDRLAKKGMRPRDVRIWMNRRGVQIGRSRFDDMIKSKIYIGYIEVFGLTCRGALPIVPLVSESTFYKARLALRERRRTKPPRETDRSDFPLRGTLRCNCGRHMTACWSRGRSATYGYYRCKTCKGVNIPRAFIDKVFARHLACQELLFAELVKPAVVEAWQNDDLGKGDRIKTLESEIFDLRELQKAIALKNAQGVLPDSIAKEQIEELSRKIEDREVHLNDNEDSAWSIGELVNFAQSFLEKLDCKWKEADLVGKKHIQTFFYPFGATLGEAWSRRTGQERLLTDFNSLRGSKLSGSVDQCDVKIKSEASRHHITPEETLNVLKDLYRHFGPGAD